jgi:solute carrier family 25 (mitochondrial folate transporter), member 32
MVAPEVDDKTRQHHTPRNIHIMSTTSSQDSSIINVKSFAPMVAGLSGGCVSTCLLLPLDNIKVRMQVNEDKRSRPHGTHFESIRIFRGILRHEGFVGLYQGLGPALLGSGISWGGYFFLYETFKKQYRSYKAAQSLDTTLSSLDNFKLACSAGTVMVFVTNPLWLIKLRIQLQMKRSSQNLNLELTQKPYTGIFDAARTIVKEEGVTALYKGMGPALMMTSHGGIQFVCYEFLKKEFNYKRPVRDTRDGYQSILERLEKSLGFLSIGAVSKM